VIREYRRLPAGLLEEIIEARHYAECKAQYDAADTSAKQKHLSTGPLMTLVKQIDLELAAEEIEKRNAG
jgi:hypothetical protein